MKRSPFETYCDGIPLRGEIFIPDAPGPYTAVPLCHGIPRGVPREGDPGYLPVAERLAKEGFAALIFNFRGCGISGGNFDMEGWGRDLSAVAEALADSGEIKSVVPWGFSGGAAASAWAAARCEKIRGAALFACPAEFAALGSIPSPSELVSFFREVGIIRDPDFPPDEEEWLAGFDRINPEKHIAMLSPRPLLLVQGSEDETVPPGHAKRLYEVAGEPKELEFIEGAPHRLRESPRALETAFDWMNRNRGRFTSP